MNIVVKQVSILREKIELSRVIIIGPKEGGNARLVVEHHYNLSYCAWGDGDIGIDKKKDLPSRPGCS
jgi:hypothetical protein